LEGLAIKFSQRVAENIDESYPASLPAEEVAQFISAKKAEAYMPELTAHDLLITADTVVVVPDGGGRSVILGKPHGADDAVAMLRMLSGRTHQVITGCCLATLERRRQFSVATDVTFKFLSDEEIKYYVDNFRPYDKAGAYGIQEWIGYIGVTGLRGSYFNVMGLPIQRIYTELQEFC